MSKGMTLADLQQQLMTCFHSSQLESCEPLLIGNYDKQARLSVYSKNISGGRIKALTGAFPVCYQILGEECFNAIAAEYVNENPSKARDLNVYGESFPLTLERVISQYKEFTELPYLAELARLEWAYHRAYYTDGHWPIMRDGDSLNEQPKIHINQSLTLITSSFPLDKIWQNNREEQGAQIIESDKEHYCFLIYRKRFWPEVHEISSDEYAFIDFCMPGLALESLVESLGEQVAELVPKFHAMEVLILSQ